MAAVHTTALPCRETSLLAIGRHCPDRAAGASGTLHRYYVHVPHWSSTMQFGEWMLVELSTEERFELEKQARSLLSSPDAGPMAAALLKQCRYQQQLLQQAVNEIARLECELM